MSNLDDQIAKYLKSENFKNQVQAISSGSASNGIGSKVRTKELATRYAAIMNKCLYTELSKIRNYENEAFLNYFSVQTEYSELTGWIINVKFDERAVMSKSLYSSAMDVYLPSLINNEWGADPTENGRWFGKDRHDKLTWNSNKFMDKYNGFMQRAIRKFRAEIKDSQVRVYLNEIYDSNAIDDY